jgi:hypothetical protein
MTELAPSLPHALPGLSEAIQAATAYRRVTFHHSDPAGWWREVCCSVDAVAEAMAEGEDDPAALVARADRALAELGDVLARRAGPGLDVLAAITAAAPAAGRTLERVGREALPLLAGAAAALRRQMETAAITIPHPHGEPMTRTMLRDLAEKFSEAFRDRDGYPARASHGDAFKGSPFVRFLDVLLSARAEAFEQRHGFASPLAPAGTISAKMIRLALAEPAPAVIWTGRADGPPIAA